MTDQRLKEIRILEHRLYRIGETLAWPGREGERMLKRSRDAITDLLNLVTTLRAEAKAAREKALEEAAQFDKSLQSASGPVHGSYMDGLKAGMYEAARRIRALAQEGETQ